MVGVIFQKTGILKKTHKQNSFKHVQNIMQESLLCREFVKEKHLFYFKTNNVCRLFCYLIIFFKCSWKKKFITKSIQSIFLFKCLILHLITNSAYNKQIDLKRILKKNSDFQFSLFRHGCQHGFYHFQWFMSLFFFFLCCFCFHKR